MWSPWAKLSSYSGSLKEIIHNTLAISFQRCLWAKNGTCQKHSKNCSKLCKNAEAFIMWSLWANLSSDSESTQEIMHNALVISFQPCFWTKIGHFTETFKKWNKSTETLKICCISWMEVGSTRRPGRSASQPASQWSWLHLHRWLPGGINYDYTYTFGLQK